MHTLTASAADVVSALSALVAGTVAGLGVAVPPGAVAVLVLREALTHGRSAGLAAGLGVATTDTGYALLALLGGAAVAGPIDAHAGVVRVVAGSILALIAVRGLLRSRGPAGAPGVEVPRQTRAEVGERSGAGARRGSPVGTWARFAAITVVNPTTALAFGVVVVALGGRWGGAAERAAFVLGVTAASAGWHVLLALLAARVGTRLDDRGRARVGTLGHALVLGLALWVVLGA